MQMTRWENAYSEFQTAWEKVKEIGGGLIITELTEADQFAEIARLKRVIEYVDGVQEAGAKDLMPLNVIISARDTSTNTFNEINHYNSNNDIGHIRNANSHLDKILSLICPFVMNSKEAAQAAGHAFSVYRKIIEESTKEWEGNSKGLVGKIKEWHGDISKKYTDITTKQDEIEEAHNLILVDDKKGNSIQTEINEYYNEITAFYNKLIKGVIDKENEEKNQPSIKSEIENAEELILKELETVQKETVGLKGFYEKIFGAKIEESEKADEREGGLKQEIAKRQKHLNDYGNEQEVVIKNLKEKIERLLPGATSAGLASAFMKLKDESKTAAGWYTFFFCCSLLVLFIIAGFLVVPELCYATPNIFGYFNISEVCKDVVVNDSWFIWFRGVLTKSLFILPALWFAMFTSKRRSEHQRLQQEYAHKESVSRSFEGYKTQIKELASKDETLLAELIEAAIKAIGYNASVTLGGKHGEDPPIAEALKSVSAIKDILKISN